MVRLHGRDLAWTVVKARHFDPSFALTKRWLHSVVLVVAFLASLSGLSARAKGGLEMTQPDQIPKTDDFKLAIVIRIEGYNSRALVVRFAAIAAVMIAVAAKIAVMFMARAH